MGGKGFVPQTFCIPKEDDAALRQIAGERRVAKADPLRAAIEASIHPPYAPAGNGRAEGDVAPATEMQAAPEWTVRYCYLPTTHGTVLRQLAFEQGVTVCDLIRAAVLGAIQDAAAA